MHIAALFDLDGVIIDTEGQYTTFWQLIGKRDFPNQLHFAQNIKGHTLKQILAEYYPNNRLKQEQVVNEINNFEQQMQYPYVAGAIDFIRALKEQGIPTAVVTSSNQEKMKVLFNRHPEFKSLFTCIFTAENAKRSKPAPDCYLNAAAQLGIDASNCIVFEDSISGLKAGCDSGATVVGLDTTNKAENIAPYCKRIIHDFTEINVAQMCQLIL